MRESLLYNKLLDQSSFTEVKSLKQFLKEREGQTFDTLQRFAEEKLYSLYCTKKVVSPGYHKQLFHPNKSYMKVLGNTPYQLALNKQSLNGLVIDPEKRLFTII